MSMSLGLHQLNVGMPLTVRDMYKHGEKALYLIKVSVTFAHVVTSLVLQLFEMFAFPISSNTCFAN